MMLSKDFKEFVVLLNENDVKYLIVGGYALALHGHPRYTKDLDVWIEMSPDNAEKIMKALEKFGLVSPELKPEDFLEKNQIIQLGYPPNRIDLLTALKDVEFDECYATRVEVIIQNVKINFIDIHNLKKNKRATGRLQDLADVEKLE
jgi:hypothetical protein